jgi:hypothetical protein
LGSCMPSGIKGTKGISAKGAWHSKLAVANSWEFLVNSVVEMFKTYQQRAYLHVRNSPHLEQPNTMNNPGFQKSGTP